MERKAEEMTNRRPEDRAIMLDCRCTFCYRPAHTRILYGPKREKEIRICQSCVRAISQQKEGPDNDERF